MNDYFLANKGQKTTLLSPNSPDTTQMVTDYHEAKKRLVLLDYDGTLVPIAHHYTHARPNETLLKTLQALSSDKKNHIVVISGRDRKTLDAWLGHLDIVLVAEHSGWIRENNTWKQRIENANPWKDHVLPVLTSFANELPGCSIEEKDFSIVWHYRNADPKKSKTIAKELTDHLLQLTIPKHINIMLGNSIIEVKDVNIGKNFVTKELIDTNHCDYIIAIGDDTTDEDMFKVLPPHAISIKVGAEGTCARFNVSAQPEVISLLQLFTKYNESA